MLARQTPVDQYRAVARAPTTASVLNTYNNAMRRASHTTVVRPMSSLSKMDAAQPVLLSQASNDTVVDVPLEESASIAPTPTPVTLASQAPASVEQYSEKQPSNMALLAERHHRALLEMPTYRYTSRNYFADLDSASQAPTPTAQAEVRPSSVIVHGALVQDQLQDFAQVQAPVTMAQDPEATPSEYDAKSPDMEHVVRETTAIHSETLETVPESDSLLLAYLQHVPFGPEALLAKCKESLQASKEVATFLKRRAALEEEYGQQLLKLCEKTMAERVEARPQRPGTFDDAWGECVRLHRRLAENHLRYSTEVGAIATQLSTAQRDAERSRKNLKDQSQRQQRRVADAQARCDKAKAKQDATSAEWERALHALAPVGGDGASAASNSTESLVGLGSDATLRRSSSTWGRKTLAGKLGRLLKDSLAAKPPAGAGHPANGNAPNANGLDDPSFRLKLERNEAEARRKAAAANETYRVQLAASNQIHDQYQTEQLPALLAGLREGCRDIDTALLRQLRQYAQATESAALEEASAISPLQDGTANALSLGHTFDLVRSDDDMHMFVGQYVPASGVRSVTLSAFTAQAASEQAAGGPPPPVFGVALSEHLDMYNVAVPLVLHDAAAVVEEFGRCKVGLYRTGGDAAKVSELRAQYDANPRGVNLNAEEWVANIGNVTDLLKRYFRELPDTLFPRATYLDFVEAAKIADSRLRVVTIHDLVNRLPDPNYATLKYLLAHLNRIQQNQQYNKMTASALAIVWAPVLLGGGDQCDLNLDLRYQCQVLETILSNYYVLFDD